MNISAFKMQVRLSLIHEQIGLKRVYNNLLTYESVSNITGSKIKTGYADPYLVNNIYCTSTL
jgi:ABC-type enterochelin transport system substrate-binding protein